MSVSFIAEPVAIYLAAPTGSGFVTGNDGEDFTFEMYAIEADRALILNEHTFEWVALERVHVRLREEQPDADPGELQVVDEAGE